MGPICIGVLLAAMGSGKKERSSRLGSSAAHSGNDALREITKGTLSTAATDSSPNSRRSAPGNAAGPQRLLSGVVKWVPSNGFWQLAL